MEYSKNSVTSLELPFNASLCVCALSEDDEGFATEDDDFFSVGIFADVVVAVVVVEVEVQIECL